MYVCKAVKDVQCQMHVRLLMRKGRVGGDRACITREYKKNRHMYMYMYIYMRVGVCAGQMSV